MKIKQLIAICFILFCSSAFATTKTISQQQLIENQQSTSPYIIIDVRSVDEFNQGHLKGALNIPFNEIEAHQVKLNKLKDKTMVVYCRSGRRAGIFETELAKQGFNLLHLSGDFLAWQEKGLPLIK